MSAVELVELPVELEVAASATESFWKTQVARACRQVQKWTIGVQVALPSSVSCATRLKPVTSSCVGVQTRWISVVLPDRRDVVTLGTSVLNVTFPLPPEPVEFESFEAAPAESDER